MPIIEKKEIARKDSPEEKRRPLFDPKYCVREVHRRHKNDPINFDYPSGRSLTDRYADMRRLGRVIEHLQHRTPESEALLKSIGLSADALSPRQCRVFAGALVNTQERMEESEICTTYRYDDERYATDPIRAGLNTRRLSSVIATEVDWAWKLRIPLGKLTLISGDPGLGKTWVAMDLLARLTRGRGFPDSDSMFKGPVNALWISGEDDDSDTIRPRIDMLGGDPSRIDSLDSVWVKSKSKNLEQQNLNLAEHLEHLAHWLHRNPLVRIVVIDPFAAFLGKTDTHRNSDVRALLAPLRELAQDCRVAIVGINHLNKGDGDNALYRGIGSIAFVAAARSSWLVSKDPDGPADRRLFTPIKNNLATEQVGGLAFRVGSEHNGISWEEGSVDVTADQALVPKSNRAPARDEAKDWLRDVLKDGPVLAAEVWEKAKADGYCEKTVKLAKKELGIRTDKTGGPGSPWSWSIPK